MAIINGTYVGGQAGRMDSATAIAMMQQGIADRQKEESALADKMDEAWSNFEKQLDAMTYTEEGLQAAIQRYRQGLVLRNKATGGRMTDADIDELTKQWMAGVKSRRKFAVDMAGINQKDGEQRAAAAAGTNSSTSTTVSVKTGGGSGGAAKPPAAAAPAPPPVEAAPAAAPQPAKTVVPPPPPALNPEIPLVQGGMAPSKPRPAGPAPAAAKYAVYDSVNNVVHGFDDLEKARAFSAAHGFVVTDTSGKVIMTVEQARAPRPAPPVPAGARTFGGLAYGDGGVVPYTPGGIPAIVGEKQTELVIPAAEAIADPQAAVAGAIQRGMPSTQLIPAAGQPAPEPEPQPSPAAMPRTTPYPEATGKKTQSTVAKLASQAKTYAQGLSSALEKAAQESGAQTEALAGKSQAEIVRATNALRRKVTAELDRNMSGISKSVAHVTSRPEFKSFIKGVDKEFAQALATASPETLSMMGLGEAAKLRSDMLITKEQQAGEDRRLEKQLAMQYRLAKIQEEAARYGSSGAETIITAYEAAQTLLKTDPYIQAQLKKGWTMDRIIAEYAPARTANWMMMRALNQPLTQVAEWQKGNIWSLGAGKVKYREPTEEEMAQFGQLNPAAKVAATRVSGSAYGSTPGASVYVGGSGQNLDTSEGPVYQGDPTDFLKAAGLGGE